MAYTRQTYGSATIADGGTIPHKLGRVPAFVNVCASTAATIATAKVDATNITVALKTNLAGAAASQQVFWEAGY